MNKARFTPTALTLALSAALLNACAPNVSREDAARATEGYVEDVNKLFVVDCLLPGQVRKLGSAMTYISQRRPIRATAAECEARGGEYVAYDRANSASALKIWLPRAMEGDAEAQMTVGQIFEKGVGQQADYQSALVWYKKAADQGNAQAQLNLGHLYEQGLGVAKDPAAAMQWYRKATGLDAANLQFAPATAQVADNSGEVESLRQEARKNREESDRLRARLSEAERRSSGERENSRARSEKEVEALRLEAEKSREESERLRERLAELEQKSRSDRQPSNRTQENESRELENLRREAEKSRQESERLRERLSEAERKSEALSQAKSGNSQEVEALRREAEKSRQESAQLRAQMLEMQQQFMDQQESLRKSQDELEDARRTLQERKAAPAQADDAALQRMEEELRQKEARLKAQQAKVSAMAASLDKERQAAKRETENARKQQAAMQAAAKQAPAPAREASAANSLQAELTETENALRGKTDEYQKQSSELTRWLTGGGQDRAKIDARKLELQTMAREIASLKDKLEQQNRRIAQAGSEPLKLAGGPDIEIIDPPVTLTRGMPTIQLNAAKRLKEIVGKIKAPEGLDTLLINDKPQTVDASGTFRAPAPSGQGEIKIVATDKKNRRADMTISLVSESDASGETYAAASPQPKGGDRAAGADFGKYYALIVGNDDYRAYPQLQTPINDAKSLDVVLRERYGFKTKLLLNANRYALMTALNDMRKIVGEQDSLLIYYAGHGEIDKSTQTAYWLPVDADKNNNANWISSQSITEFIAIMPARHTIVVADSCYSGALTGAAVAKLPEGMDPDKRAKWLKIMSARKGRTVMTSGGVAPVMDAGGGGHSVFANAFLKVLRANARVIEDYDIFRDVSNQVRGASARVGFQQTPQYAPLQHSGHEGSPFVFTPEA
jgi:hypothetical protein